MPPPTISTTSTTSTIRKEAEDMPKHGRILPGSGIGIGIRDRDRRAGIRDLDSDRNRADRGGFRPLAYLSAHDATSTATEHDGPRSAMEGAGVARCRGGRHVCLWRDVDRHLLPAQLPEPAAAGRSRPLLRHDDRGAAGGLPRLQALPARHGRPRAARHRGGAPRLGLSGDARRSRPSRSATSRASRR